MRHILIIEDDRDIASIERDYLELNGYQVEIAPDGVTGLERALRGSFDLILLDLMLPGMDGFSVCRRLREATDIPILMVTARREDLYEKVWGLEAVGDNATAAVHINRLREKLEQNPSHPRYIQTVWGAGYRFRAQESGGGD